VSQPEVSRPHGFWSVDDQSRYQRSRVASQALLQLSNASVDQQTLVHEIAQVCSLNDEQLSRIYHLEQALDQALLYLDELRLKVRDQGILETQLATTEEYASIQRQAIAHLKKQLERQQQAIELYRAGMGDRDQFFLQLIERINTLADDHYTRLERLHQRLETDRDETRAHYQRLDTTIKELQTALEARQRQILDLEAEALTAHSQVVELEMEISACHQRIRELYLRLEERSLPPTEASLTPDETASPPSTDLAAEHWLGTPPSPPDDVEGQTAIQKLARSNLQRQTLEQQVEQQARQIAKLQQQCQELEQDRDRQTAALEERDRQNAEMQEQILKQAKQASEYEAAVQHWKDRHTLSQRQMRQLRDVLQQVLPGPDTETPADAFPALAELLDAMQTLLTPEGDETDDTPISSHFGTLAVPDFLIRRRLRRPSPRTKASESAPVPDPPSDDDA
jgi:chromosome segregation ATPase